MRQRVFLFCEYDRPIYGLLYQESCECEMHVTVRHAVMFTIKEDHEPIPDERAQQFLAAFNEL